MAVVEPSRGAFDPGNWRLRFLLKCSGRPCSAVRVPIPVNCNFKSISERAPVAMDMLRKVTVTRTYNAAQTYVAPGKLQYHPNHCWKQCE